MTGNYLSTAADQTPKKVPDMVAKRLLADPRTEKSLFFLYPRLDSTVKVLAVVGIKNF